MCAYTISSTESGTMHVACLWGPNLCKFSDYTTVTRIPSFQLSHCCMCHILVFCDLINLSLYKYFKRVDISILLCCSEWSERSFCTSFITVTVQHFCNCNVTQPNILVNRILWSYSHCIGFCFTVDACTGHDDIRDLAIYC